MTSKEKAINRINKNKVRLTSVESNAKERGQKILLSSIHSVDFKFNVFCFPFFGGMTLKITVQSGLTDDSKEIVDLRPRHSF